MRQKLKDVGQKIQGLLERRRTAVALGILLPLGMLILDPTVFTSTLGEPLFGRVKPFAYAAVGSGVVALLSQMWIKRPRAILAGILAAGATFAFGLGVALLPFSIVGILLMGLGLLGFSPFLTGAVFARRAELIYAAAPSHGRRTRFWLGFAAFFAFAAGVQWRATAVWQDSVADICSGNAERNARGTERLSQWRSLLNLRQLGVVHAHENDRAKQQRIEGAYRQLTGRELLADISD